MEKTNVILIALEDEFAGNNGAQLTTKDREYPVYLKSGNNAKVIMDDGDTFNIGSFVNDKFWGSYMVGTLFKIKEGTNND
jgi:hypothetical protein